MRFNVTLGQEPAEGPDAIGAGFSNVTTPEVTMEAVEYREGNYVYTRKYPGIATMNDITMSRGVTVKDSTFWAWAKRTAEGGGNYRSDLTIHHYHRANTLLGEGSSKNFTQWSTETSAAARRYVVFEAFPIRHKVAGDLDATASEISIMELDVGFEHFTIEEDTVTTAPVSVTSLNATTP